MKRIAIVGSRQRDEWKDYLVCKAKFFEIYKKGDHIVSGGALFGGDRFAEIIALTLVGVKERLAWNYGFDLRRHHMTRLDAPISVWLPDWNTHQRAAGFIRNRDIVMDCDCMIAVVAQDRTGGTEDAVKQAKKKGKKVYIVGEFNEKDYPDAPEEPYGPYGGRKRRRIRRPE